MTDEGLEVWSGGVNTWECDEMGHLNVRFWVAKAQEGLAGLAAAMAMPRAFAANGEATMVVREQHIRFLREAHAGAALHMTGGVIDIEESRARLLLVIRHPDGQPAATFQMVVEHVTPRELRAFPWPRRVLERAMALKVDVPPFAAARSLDLASTTPTAGLDRAQALGLKRIGLGVIGPAECDVFGRMRPEIFIGRVSDGAARLFGQVRALPELDPGAPEPRIGGAVLEYRVLHLDWPRAGDGVELRSGFAGCAARTRRVVHWMVDPISGRPWASAEAVAVSFDLDRRKVIELSAAALDGYRALVSPGLVL